MSELIGVYIETPKDNTDYILLGGRPELLKIPMEEAPTEVINEWENLLEQTKNYESENIGTGLANNIVVRKDSSIGKYIISLIGKKIENLADKISHYEVMCAMNVAIFESNPISEKLIVLFKNQVSGDPKDLEQKYGAEVVEYIKENNDFNFYYRKITGKYYPRDYFVYENGQLSRKKIAEVQKQKVIDNN